MMNHVCFWCVEVYKTDTHLIIKNKILKMKMKTWIYDEQKLIIHILCKTKFLFKLYG